MIKKDWIVVLVITFIVFMIWLLSDLYHTRPGVEITPKLQEALDPLNPTLDPQTLEKIKQLEVIDTTQVAGQITLPPSQSTSSAAPYP